jgi:undecaprenyl-diphosphatase
MDFFDVDRWIGQAINAPARRSFLLDTLIALPMRNELVKAAPLLACLIVAWFAGSAEQKLSRRRVLLVTMFAALAATGVSRLISGSNALPRPYAFNERVYRLEEGELLEQPSRGLRTPLDNASVERAQRLTAADMPPNDFGSFPSDHASLFFTLALGIATAWPRCGAVALAWTALGILLPKLWTGLHSPLDIAGGVLLGSTILTIALLVQRRFFAEQWRKAAAWTLRYEAITAATLFVFLFEVAATFDHVSELARGVARRLL